MNSQTRTSESIKSMQAFYMMMPKQNTVVSCGFLVHEHKVDFNIRKPIIYFTWAYKKLEAAGKYKRCHKVKRLGKIH